MVRSQQAARRDWSALSERLHGLGVHTPCVLSGDQAPPLAFYAGCQSMQIHGNDASATLAGLLGTANMTRLAVVENATHRPSYTQGWSRHTFTTPNQHHWRIYVPPPPPSAAPRS
jgi:hypothetical protein